MGSQRRQNKRAPRTRGPESLVLGSIERDERPRDLQRRQGSRSTTNRYTWLREQTKSTRRKGCSNQHYLPVLSSLRHPFLASMLLFYASPLFQEFLPRLSATTFLLRVPSLERSRNLYYANDSRRNRSRSIIPFDRLERDRSQGKTVVTST